MASPIVTVSGSPAACSRAATFTTSPVTGPRSALACAVDGLAARDAHAQAERARREPEAGADALHRGHEREPRPHRTLRVVVADARRAEDGHRRVPDELLELAAVARDRLAHRLEVRVLHERHVLGVEPLRQRRESDEVGEQNRHHPPLDRPLRGHERVYDGHPERIGSAP